MKKALVLCSMVLLLVLSLFTFASCGQDNNLTVNFIVGEQTIKSIKVESGNSIETVPSIPEKIGYIGEWSVSDFNNITKDMDVVAKYTPKKYEITLDYNHADNEPSIEEKITVEYDGNISGLPEVYKLGAEFTGWTVNGIVIIEDDIWNFDIDAPVAIANWIVHYSALEYTKTTNEYVVSGMGNCKDTEIVIPNFYNGLPVVAIKENAFKDCKTINGIVVGKNVNSIGDSAFEGCENLKTVINNSSILNIGKGAESNGKIAFYCDKVSNAKNVGNYLFNTYNGINYLIGYDGADSDLVLPIDFDGENYIIWDEAFYNCTFIKSITIPKEVEYVGVDAFKGCVIENANIPAHAIEKVKNDKLCILEINDGEYIDSNVFYGCKSITKVVLSDSVYGIGKNAFKNCLNLKSITLGSGLNEIGENAFSGCVNLVEIINNSYLLLEKGNTDNGNISKNALAIHTDESKIELVGDYYFVKGDDGVNYLFEYIGKETSLTLPTDYNSKNYSIAPNAFLNNLLLTKIVIPSGVDNIGNDAFKNCEKLNTVEIGDGIKSIGSRAFYWCTYLTDIKISNSVESIGENAFYGCTRVSVDYLGKIEEWAQISFNDEYSNPIYYANKLSINGTTVKDIILEDNIVEVKNYAFYKCYELESVKIIGNASKIGISAFMNCKNINSVILGNYVFTIEKNAFKNCDNIMTITLGNKIREIRENAFSGCNHLVEIINCSSLSLTKGSVDNGNISKNAVAIHTDNSKIKLVGDYYFVEGDDGVNYLTKYVGKDTNITLPVPAEKITEEQEERVIYYAVAQNAFLCCDFLSSVIIPKNYVSIGSSAFYYCGALSNVIIESGDIDIITKDKDGEDKTTYIKVGVISIGDHTFYNCNNLTNITIADTVTSIGSNAFENCSKLTGLIIPKTVTSIGKDVCDKLYYAGSQEEWKKNVKCSNGVGKTTVYYYSKSEPKLNSEGTAYDGNYWYYDVNDNPTIWVKDD